MNNARILITDNGWYSSLPGATKDFVMRKLTLAERKKGWRLSFADQRDGHALKEFDNV